MQLLGSTGRNCGSLCATVRSTCVTGTTTRTIGHVSIHCSD
jgi:hypothetical protein